MPIASLMQRFVDDELVRSATLIERTRAGTVQLLRSSIESAPNASERSHHFELLEALQRHASRFDTRFIESLRSRVLEELKGPVSASTSGAGQAGELELMDEARVEVDIEISRAMQLIDTTAEWELRELQTFTSTLNGQSHVSAESNPMRPVVYAGALWQAACAVCVLEVQRSILLRLAAGVMAGLLRNAWAAASTRLESQGVEPGVYRTVLMAPGAAAGNADAMGVARGVLSALLARMPGAAGSSADAQSAVAPHAAELERALLKLEEIFSQRMVESSNPLESAPESLEARLNRLKDQRMALVASAGKSAHRRVVELVSRLFEAILSDESLPLALRSSLARLQVPTLRVAVADAVVAESQQHPVWLLMERIAESSYRHPQGNDTRLAELLTLCASVVEEINGAPSPTAANFQRGLNRVDAFLADQLQRQLRAGKPAADALQLAERREVLEQHLSHRLANQMVPVRTTAGLRRFVTASWAKVIAEAMLRYGEHVEPTLGYISIVDDLLWSLQIPDHPQSRQRLLSLIPELLRRLQAGMALIGLPAAERQSVLDELMAVHTQALRRGSAGGEAALTPQEIVQRMRDEVVPALSDLPRFGDSVIDLSSMDTVPADMLPPGNGTAPLDPHADVTALRVSDRRRVFLQGRWTRVQLLWRSEHGQFLLFAGESPSRTHSITRRALERLSSAGLVQPAQAQTLLQRAVARLSSELSFPT